MKKLLLRDTHMLMLGLHNSYKFLFLITHGNGTFFSEITSTMHKAIMCFDAYQMDTCIWWEKIVPTPNFWLVARTNVLRKQDRSTADFALEFQARSGRVRRKNCFECASPLPSVPPPLLVCISNQPKFPKRLVRRYIDIECPIDQSTRSAEQHMPLLFQLCPSMFQKGLPPAFVSLALILFSQSLIRPD